MKIIRIPDNCISGAQDIRVPEAIYRIILKDTWYYGGGCCSGFRIHIEKETMIATLESRCSQEEVEVEVFDAPAEENSPTRIPELILTIY
jgi:hypothetical protein